MSSVTEFLRFNNMDNLIIILFHYLCIGKIVPNNDRQYIKIGAKFSAKKTLIFLKAALINRFRKRRDTLALRHPFINSHAQAWLFLFMPEP